MSPSYCIKYLLYKPLVHLLQNKDVGYLNIGFDVWKREFKNRIQELDWKDKLETIKKNIKLLKKHLSEDDLFEIDMNNFEPVDF